MKDSSEDKVSDQDTADKALEDLSEGVRHHNAGRLDEAEAMYRRVLKAHPDNADALHLLGVAARQAGRHDVAVDLIQRAIARNGRNPSYHANLGTALEVSVRGAPTAPAGVRWQRRRPRRGTNSLPARTRKHGRKGNAHFHSPAKLVSTIHESHEGEQEVLAGRRDKGAGRGGGGGVGVGVAGGGRGGGGAEAGPAHPLHPG